MSGERLPSGVDGWGSGRDDEVPGVDRGGSADRLVRLEVAQQLMLDACVRLDTVRRAPLEAIGTVAAETVRSPRPSPPFDNSAMDGVAVRSSDCGREATTLRLVDTVLAGGNGRPVGAGEAARVMTGAPIPPGADAVCPQEACTPGAGGTVLVGPVVPRGLHVRRVGEDLVPGAPVLPAGAPIDVHTAGLLGSVGIREVAVVRPPTVGVVSTGDEVVDAASGSQLSTAQIFDANKVMLLAAVAQAGCEPVDLGALADDESALATLLAAAAGRCDVVVTTGGVSFGHRDIVRSHLQGSGADLVHALQVAIKPGRPQVFARVNRGTTAVFGLPGNPVAAAISFELFVRPALRKMAGHQRWFRPRIVARAADRLSRRSDGKLHLRPVVFAPGSPPWAHGRARQGPHQLTSMAGAHGLALLPDGVGAEVGAEVRCLVLDADALAAALSIGAPAPVAAVEAGLTGARS